VSMAIFSYVKETLFPVFLKPSKEFSRYPSSHRVAKNIASEEKKYPMFE